MLKEELQLLQEPGSYVGEVVKVMGKSKVLVKVGDLSSFHANQDDHLLSSIQFLLKLVTSWKFSQW